MSNPHTLDGKRFGALRVIERFSRQAAGWTHLCWCLTCGAIQHRLGSHLVHGHRDRCSACKAKGRPAPGKKHAKRPSDEAIQAFKDDANNLPDMRKLPTAAERLAAIQHRELQRDLRQFSLRAARLAEDMERRGLRPEFAEVAQDLAQELKREARS